MKVMNTAGLTITLLYFVNIYSDVYIIRHLYRDYRVKAALCLLKILCKDVMLH